MKRFFKNTLLLALPLVIWGLMIVIIDPYNYFNFAVVNNNSKKSAAELNQLMYSSIDYIRAPSENLLIGDSRTELLPIDSIDKLSSQKYKRVVIHGAKLNEIFEFFYMANDVRPIKRIVIGINFNMFNRYGYQDRISGIKKVLSNPFMYVYNKDVAEGAYVTLNHLFFKKDINSKPPMTKEDFWKWNITNKASDWYGKYEFPTQLYAQLVAFDKFASSHRIEVIFIIVPHHDEFHQRLLSFGLGEEEKKFVRIMSSLHAKVYDFDYLNPITVNKSNFRDPVHYNDSIGNLIVREIWTNKLTIGKKLTQN